MPRFSNRTFKRVKKGIISNTVKRRAVEVRNLQHVDAPSPSASSRKIGEGVRTDLDDDGKCSGFRIIDLSILSSIINKSCLCVSCGSNKLKIYDDGNRKGIVCTLHILCEGCGSDTEFSTSSSQNHVLEANVRLSYAMRCVGLGREGANIFCGVMNMPPPITSFRSMNNKLCSALEVVCDKSMSDAVQEAITLNTDENSHDLCVSCDGTWMKRGHTSLHGVSTVVSVDTGKVIDVQVMSKYCSVCDARKPFSDKQQEIKWQDNHKLSCHKNYHGSSGGMEAAGMQMIFHRSVMKYGVRYTQYLGDGDSSSFKHLLDSKPYGPSCSIEKLECVGHVQKRMGSRLLKLIKENKGKKLEDGKPIGGIGRLTQKEVKNMQIYYGSAIRNNVGNLEEMRRAVWAIFFHRLSTDDNPQHGLCGSWCPQKKSVECGHIYHHKHSLPLAVMNEIKPIFKALSQPELLKKCLHGKTQNPNESLNNLIWKRCPKTTFVSSRVVQIATYDAILVFNGGNDGRLKVMKELGFEPGVFMKYILKEVDTKRIKFSEIAEQKIQQIARQKKHLKRAALEESHSEEYGAGEF